MKIPRLLIASAAVAVLAFGVASCGGDDATETTTTTVASTTTTAGTGTTAGPTTTTAGVTTSSPGGSDDYVTEVTVTAEATLFDVTEITAKAGVEITVTLKNIDTEADAPHNIHFRVGSEDYFTALSEATNETDLVFTPTAAGTGTFFCDTHPDLMFGTFIVIP